MDTQADANRNVGDHSERNRLVGEAFEQHRSRLTVLASRIVRHRADPEDVVSEASLKAIAKWDTYNPSMKLYNWLAAIVENTARD